MLSGPRITVDDDCTICIHLHLPIGVCPASTMFFPVHSMMLRCQFFSSLTHPHLISLQDIFGQCKCLSIDMFKPSALSAFTIFSKLSVFKSLLQLLIAFQSLSHMGSFKCYVMQMGVGGCPIVWGKALQFIWFNVFGITRGWVGVQIQGKKRYVTLEWPLCGVRYICLPDTLVYC